MYVFISHSSKNAEIAQELCELIEKAEHKCFIAPRDIRSGHEYAEEIINGIDKSNVMLLMLSAESNESPHVLREVERAVSRKIPIIVYRLEDVELSKSMEYFLMTHQWVNAKAKIDHSEVLKCINELAGCSDSDDEDAEHEMVSDYLSKAKKSCLIFGIALLAVLIAGGTAIALHGSNSSENGTSTNGSTNEAQTAEAILPDVQLGDSLMFGSYNEQPIEWRVISLSEDGAEATLISDRILTMKCYDAAEGGKYNSYNGEDYWTTPSAELEPELDRMIRGDNRWESSNIRTWLNSDKENVTYTGQVPSADAMSEKTNGYNTEPGFLNEFTQEEYATIIPTEISTNGSSTTDMVYLLSSEELALLETADVSRYSVPTEQAVALDTSRWYTLHMSDYGVDDHYWWLRDSDGSTASGVNVVTFSYAGGNVLSQPAGLEGYGIRPVITVDLSSESIEIKE